MGNRYQSQLGKAYIGAPFGNLFPAQLTLNGVEILNIEVDHLSRLTLLPFHHQDPFDRLIASQALVEKVPVLGLDSFRHLRRHSILVVWPAERQRLDKLRFGRFVRVAITKSGFHCSRLQKTTFVPLEVVA